MKKNLLAVFTVSLFVLVLSSKADAMLVNGGFDDLSSNVEGKIFNRTQSDLTSGQWDVYDNLPGWQSGKGTAGIEVQYNSVVKANSGNYYVELDSHGGSNTNSSMFQTVDLSKGDYNLGWMYHARTDDANDNGIKAFLKDSSGNSIAIDEISQQTTNQVWENIDWTFSITEAGLYELWFEAFGEENTYGGFIDSVELALLSSGGPGNGGPAPVPEPATMLLFGTGLACLAGVARRKKK